MPVFIISFLHHTDDDDTPLLVVPLPQSDNEDINNPELAHTDEVADDADRAQDERWPADADCLCGLEYLRRKLIQSRHIESIRYLLTTAFGGDDAQSRHNNLDNTSNAGEKHARDEAEHVCTTSSVCHLF